MSRAETRRADYATCLSCWNVVFCFNFLIIIMLDYACVEENENTVDPGYSEPLGTAHRCSLYPGFTISGLSSILVSR